MVSMTKWILVAAVVVAAVLTVAVSAQDEDSYEFVELVDRLDASMEAAPKSSVRTAAQAARVSAMMAKSRANALDLCQKLYPPAGKAPVAPSAVGEQVTDKRRKLPTQKECSEILGLLSDANKHMLPAGSTMPSFIHTPKGAKGGAAPGQGAARPGAARQGAARQGAVPGKAPGGAKPKPRFSDSSMEAVEQMVADAEAQALATGARVRIQPIVFVHGIWSKPARWADFANMLNAKVRAGTLAACFNTHSWNFADLDAANVAALKTTITSTLTLCKDYLPSADPNVILVTHSKGGLISRAYLRQYPEPAQSRVSGLYFIGTPNCGSPMADFYMEQENPLTSFDHCAFALGGLAGRTRYAGCARRKLEHKSGWLNFLDPVATPNSICDTASFARQPGGAVCQELYQCQWRRLCKDAITPGERVDLVASIDSHPTQTFASMVPQTATQNLQQGGITSLHAVKLKRVAAVSGTSTGFVGLGLNFGHYNAAGASDGCVLQKDLHQCPGDIPIALIGTAAVTHSDEAAKPIGPGAQLAEMIIADIIKYFGKTE